MNLLQEMLEQNILNKYSLCKSCLRNCIDTFILKYYVLFIL